MLETWEGGMIMPGSIRLMLPQLMFEHGDNVSELARLLGVSWETAKKKMSGKSPLTNEEIAFLCDRYNVTPSEIFVFQAAEA